MLFRSFQSPQVASVDVKNSVIENTLKIQEKPSYSPIPSQQKKENQSLVVAKPIPEKPIEAKLPEVALETKAKPAPSKTDVVKKSIDIVKTIAKPETNPKKVIVAKTWVVQLGVFSDPIRAAKLEKQVKEQGFPVFISKWANAKGKMMASVYVGPQEKRDNAKALVTQLKERLKLNGIIVAYSHETQKG